MNSKAASERYQRQVLELSKQSGNETCADCGGRYPRWSSWNLGIFLCVNCAGVHRKMGTHISKIKSLTLDTWTKEQVEKVREGGNVKNNLKYNPDERRNRPPANVDEGERNSELERFIFDKYKGKFMDRRPPPVPSKDPSAGIFRADQMRQRRPEDIPNGLTVNQPPPRSRTAPIPTSFPEAKSSITPALPLLSPNQQRQPVSADASFVLRNVSNPESTLAAPTNLPARSSSAAISNGHLSQTTGATSAIASAPSTSSSVFDDLLQLNGGPSTDTQQPPLQMQSTSYQPQNLANPWATLGTQQQAILSPMMMQNTSTSAYFQQVPQQSTSASAPPQHAFFSQGADRSASLGNMAFQPQQMSTNHFTGSAGNPFFGNTNAHLMGQAAFAPSTYMYQHTGSFQQQQQQSPFSQQYQQPQSQPQSQSQAPFGTFASTMMPTGQQQQSQPFATNNMQATSHTQNMWG